MTIKESMKFEQDLYDLINNCGLSVDTAFYILKSVYLDFQKTLLDCAKTEQDDPVTHETVNYKMDPEQYQNLEFKGEHLNEQPVD